LPFLIPARSIPSSASLSRSRASSLDQRADWIEATGRSAAGKPLVLSACFFSGVPGAPLHAATSSAAEQARAVPNRILIDILHIDLLAGDALRERGGGERIDGAIE